MSAGRRHLERARTDRRLGIVGAVLGLLTLMVLVGTAPKVGYVRDEGIYFEASRHYGTWASLWVRAPDKAADPKIRDRLFRINNEHPALMKLAGGVSANLLARPPAPGSADERRATDRPAGGRLHVLEEGTAMRLPAMIVAALGVVLLFFAGVRRGEGLTGGLLAGLGFILLPRVFFHAHLHAFDVPVAVAVLAVWLVYQRSLDDPRFALLLGPTLGLAVSIKHNAVFMLPLLGLHYLACLAVARLVRGQRLRVGQCLPAPFLSIAVLTPLTVLAAWPWLWRAPLERLWGYYTFHREHAYYNMAFLGVNYNEPPMPVAYPWVMTFATVPLVLLALVLLGGAWGLRRELADVRTSPGSPAAEPSWLRPLPWGYAELEETGLVMLTVFPLVLISLPSIPIFGGTKHWLTAYPFMLLLAAGIYPRLFQWALAHDRLQRLRHGVWRHLPVVALALVLGPALAATVDGHPYNLSQYTAAVGGPRGAASLGLNRGYWGHAVLPLLEAGRTDAAPGPVYLHDLHPLCMRQYQREGRWPEHWRSSRPRPQGSALMFYEQHMLDDEVDIWRGMETTTPAELITLDDVPLTARY